LIFLISLPFMIKKYLSHCLIALALSGCNSFKLDLLFPKPTDWITDGGSNARTYRVDEQELQFPLKELAQLNFQAGFGHDALRAVGNHIWVANMKGEVHVWDMNLKKKEGYVGIGEGIEGGMALYENLFIVPHASGKKSLTAFDYTTSAKAWTLKGEPVSAGLLLDHERIFMADLKGHISAVEVKTGKPLWQVSIREKETAIWATPVSDGRQLFVVDENGTLAALDLNTGNKNWLLELQVPVRVTPVWNEAEKVLYVVNTKGEVIVVSGEGRMLHRWQVFPSTVRLATPSWTGERLILGNSAGQVASINPVTGEKDWIFQTDGTFVAPPLVMGNVVLIGGMDRVLYVLERATGAVIWKQALKGRIKSVPVVHKGMVFVLSEPNLMYVFKSEK
jgi:outer membrane protein assembly factor BamB